MDEKEQEALLVEATWLNDQAAKGVFRIKCMHCSLNTALEDDTSVPKHKNAEGNDCPGSFETDYMVEKTAFQLLDDQGNVIEETPTLDVFCEWCWRVVPMTIDFVMELHENNEGETCSASQTNYYVNLDEGLRLQAEEWAKRNKSMRAWEGVGRTLVAVEKLLPAAAFGAAIAALFKDADGWYGSLLAIMILLGIAFVAGWGEEGVKLYIRRLQTKPMKGQKKGSVPE